MVTETIKTNMDNGIYTPEETALLEKTLELRVQMIDAIFKEGVPKHGGTIRVMNEVMSAIDTAINNKANARLKATDTKNQSEIKEQVAELLRQQSKRISQHTRENIEDEVVLTEEEVASLGGVPEFVPGEASLEYKPVELDDVMGEEFGNGQ